MTGRARGFRPANGAARHTSDWKSWPYSLIGHRSNALSPGVRRRASLVVPRPYAWIGNRGAAGRV